MSTRSRPTRSRALALAAPLALALAAAAPARAQSIDFTVSDVVLVQVVQEGATELIAERPMHVRVGVGVSNPTNPPKEVDALVRIYVDGEEIDDSPIFSNNGPFTAQGVFIPQLGVTSLNFSWIPPVSDDVVFEVHVNPPGPNAVPEADPGNNVFASAPQSFREQRRLELAYAPIDLRPGGGSVPNLPDPDLIKPGVGDNFVQGILPTGSIEYRRIDAESKLWTNSVQGSGSALNSSLTNDLFLMNPRPDFIYGWVPGGLPYNGQAFLNGKASMGNTQSIRHQRTYAHELGHNFGLGHNGISSGDFGLDVEQHLWLTEGLGKQKESSLNDIMVPGQLTPSAWIAESTYDFIKGQPEFVPGSDTDSDADDGGPRLLVSGLWNRATGELQLQPALEVPAAGPAAAPAPEHLADLELRLSARGAPGRVVPVTARTAGDACVDPAHAAHEPDADGAADSAAHVDPWVGFGLLVPARADSGAEWERLAVVGRGAAPLAPASVERSAHAPVVELLTPRAGERLGSTVEVTWQASDADGDALHATLRYCPDGDDHFVPLVVHTTATSHVVDLARLPHFRAGHGYFELLVSDGLRTTRARSAPLAGGGAFASAGGNAPFVEIYHPDDGFKFRQGMNVILHSSGWDLEDHRLDGASIEWSSDVDGVIGHGRRLIVTDLSPGEHAITVTATDSGGLTSSRTNEILVLEREVPFADPVFCADDLGFGGPGDSVLSLCGGDLTAGGSAELLLTGAPPLSAAFLALGLGSNPVPVKGGQLVPFPWSALLARQTDAAGEVSNPGVSDPGVDLEFFLQYVVVDPAQPAGFGFSNALRVEF